MDPALVTVLVVAVLAVGVFIGWEARLMRLKEEIRKGEFDPWKYGKSRDD